MLLFQAIVELRFRAAVAVGVRTPIPIAILDQPILEALKLATGTRLVLHYRRRRLAVWVCELARYPQTTPQGFAPHDVIWLSKRARDLLRVDDKDSYVIAEPRARIPLEIIPAIQQDLPRANEVDVDRSIVKDLRTTRAIAYSNFGAVPLHLRERDMKDGQAIRMSMLTRTLLNVKVGDPIEISAFQTERLFLADRVRGRKGIVAIVRVVAAVRYLFRGAINLLEAVLRLFLQAPVLSMRTVEAEIGDDTNRVVRVTPETLRLLGINPGDEVFLEWGDSRVLGVALEKLKSPAPPGAVEAATEDDWGGDPRHDEVPDHLVVGISAVMRGELRIPRRTIVNVRRRVLSVFAQRVNELTIPIGGLIFAALALEKITSLQAIVGGVIVTLLAMAPVKYRAAPRGRWP